MKNGEKIENYYEWHYVMEKYIWDLNNWSEFLNEDNLEEFSKFKKYGSKMEL
jgi:hypothetical protein